MTVLLDTHVWIWWLLGSHELPRRDRAALDRLASRADLRLAAVSLWEAQMLYAKRRLVLDRPFDVWIREAASAAVVQIEPLDVDVAIAVDGLPPSFHGDPADRLIVATSRARRLPLATYDRVIRKSRASAIWRA